MSLPLFKINWKIPLRAPNTMELRDFFRAFSSWIASSGEVLTDVADYRHLRGGTRIILVGFEADYVIDDAGGTMGLVYARKRPGPGSDRDRIASALAKLIAAAARIEGDPLFAGRTLFDRNRLVFVANDRAIAPNTPETLARLKPETEAAVAEHFPGVPWTVRPAGNDPGERFALVFQGFGPHS